MINDRIPLEAMIQSECMREYVIKTSWTFTDVQKATLLANGWVGNLPLEEQFRYLRILLDSTNDTELKSQITAYLDRMERHLRELKDNHDRNCIYILKVENDTEGDNYYRISPEGYFFDYELAYESGCKQNRRFQIEKLFVANEDDDDYVVAYIHFDENGNAVYLGNCEYDNSEEKFVNTFFPLPNPFERGDIVRRVGSDKDEDLGIVETSQKQCRETFERLKNKPEFYSEFGDDRIRVVFLNDDGTFGHAHIIPIYLERYQPEWGDHHTADGTRDNLLLAASQMYKGEGSLDELWYFTMEYREARRKENH